MQKTIYHWLFFVCCAVLPIGLNGKIDSKKAPTTLSANPVFVEAPRHFPTANPLDRLKMPKFVRKFIEKRLHTEGSLKKETAPKNTFWGRVFTIFLLAIAAVLLVYFLQGTIGLGLATLAIVSYWRNRNRIAAWERRQKERLDGYATTESGEKIYKNDKNSPLKNGTNKWTNRAVKRFLWGVSLIFLTFILALSAIFIDVSAVVGTIFILTFFVGYGFTIASVVNALQAINAKEPQSGWAWLIVAFGIPLILVIANIIIAIGSF